MKRETTKRGLMEGGAAERLELVERVGGEVRLRGSWRGFLCFVYLDLTGLGRHHCTCGDTDFQSLYRRPRAGPRFCPHVVAAAIRERRHELLLPFLAGRAK